MFSKPPDLVEVIPRLFLGSAPSRRDVPRIARLGINRVIDLRAEDTAPSEWPPPVVAKRLPFEDHGTPTVDELGSAASEVAELMSEGHLVFVHCHAGLERTPTVVCAALLIIGWHLADAYQRVLEARPGAAPTEGQLAALGGLARRISKDSP